jgi:amino-acid N-acetyltransferase
LFVLTTVAAHWFRERGFVEKTPADLPEEKRLVYNQQRRSKIFAKTL